MQGLPEQDGDGGFAGRGSGEGEDGLSSLITCRDARNMKRSSWSGLRGDARFENRGDDDGRTPGIGT